MANLRITNLAKKKFNIPIGTRAITRLDREDDPIITEYTIKSLGIVSCLNLHIDLTDSPVHRRYVLRDSDGIIILDTKYIGFGKFPNVPINEGETYSMLGAKKFVAVDENITYGRVDAIIPVITLDFEDSGDTEDVIVTYEDVITLSSPIYLLSIELDKVYPENSEFEFTTYFAPFDGIVSVDLFNVCNKEEWEE